ncbi:hypothetical protein U1Q18_006370 [Sarracenia purpurea var. burkii]
MPPLHFVPFLCPRSSPFLPLFSFTLYVDCLSYFKHVTTSIGNANLGRHYVSSLHSLPLVSSVSPSLPLSLHTLLSLPLVYTLFPTLLSIFALSNFFILTGTRLRTKDELTSVFNLYGS